MLHLTRSKAGYTARCRLQCTDATSHAQQSWSYSTLQVTVHRCYISRAAKLIIQHAAGYSAQMLHLTCSKAGHTARCRLQCTDATSHAQQSWSYSTLQVTVHRCYISRAAKLIIQHPVGPLLFSRGYSAATPPPPPPPIKAGHTIQCWPP